MKLPRILQVPLSFLVSERLLITQGSARPQRSSHRLVIASVRLSGAVKIKDPARLDLYDGTVIMLVSISYWLVMRILLCLWQRSPLWGRPIMLLLDLTCRAYRGCVLAREYPHDKRAEIDLDVVHLLSCHLSRLLFSALLIFMLYNYGDRCRPAL
jgi:hypothetical protein